MITPTRFGLKYAPIPTLALEYEDDLSSVEDAGTTSLYLLRENEPRRRVKKLHVVELPTLTKASETRALAEQLQRDNSRFLAPSVVNDAQLKRLLDLLVEHLQPDRRAAEVASTSPPAHPGVISTAHDSEDDKDEGLGEESFMEESIVEASQSMAASEGDAETPIAPSTAPLTSRTEDVAKAHRGTFLSQESESDEEDVKQQEGALTGSNGEGEQSDDEQQESLAKPIEPASTEPASGRVDTKSEEDEAEKKRSLRSDSEISEEEVQSEELEYFSEDGSDEDSF